MRPLAVQLYTVRDLVTDDTEGTLRRLADIGYRAVEPTVGLLGDTVRFRGLLDELGLTACSLHAPVLGPDRDQIAAAARMIGAGTVIVPAVPPEDFADRAGVENVARRLSEAAAWAAGEGLRLGYHNHHWEITHRIDGRTALEVLAEQLPPDVVLEIDVYWAAAGGEDVPDLLGRLGSRVRYLHVKDGPATIEDPMTAVGAGVVPIPAILDAAPPEAWHIVELDRCATDMITALADSYAYLADLRHAGAAR